MGKQETLKDYILGEIRLGRLKPGDRLYSRNDFMAKFSCARATVDQVISGLVKDKVLESEKGSGTFVAAQGKRVAGKETAIVAPLIGHPSMPQQMIHAFLESSGNAGSIRYFTFDELKHPRSWEECKKQRGIVFIQPDVQHSPLLYEARALKVPHLVLYRDPPESSFISIDNYGAMAGLVDALYARGRRKIAYAGLRQSRFSFPEQRYAGYLEGLLRNNLPLNREQVGLLPETGEASFLKTLFIGKDRPDALISAQVPLGLVIKALDGRGLTPGKDVLLAGTDEVMKNTYAFPVLTPRTITAEVGSRGAEVFQKLLKSPEFIIQEYITPEIIEC
jgi:GntR family transcriptional regulator, arabinose operon transcriptional repressor